MNSSRMMGSYMRIFSCQLGFFGSVVGGTERMWVVIAEQMEGLMLAHSRCDSRMRKIGVMMGSSFCCLLGRGSSRSKANGRGGEFCRLRTRGGEGEKASRVSSSESRISSISMKRPDPLRGVECRCWVDSKCGGDFPADLDLDLWAAVMALVALGGRPRRLEGGPAVVAGRDADKAGTFEAA